MGLTTSKIRRHYKTPEVQETIQRISKSGEHSRAGNGDGNIWYRSKAGKKNKIDLSVLSDYNFLADKCRTLYWTLNLFEPDIYDLDYNEVEKTESPFISRSYTAGYTYGIDIDHVHETDIHDPEVKKAVEDMAQFYVDKLREHVPNSVYVAYSGGGIYVMVHHMVFAQHFEKFRNTEEAHVILLTLLDAFDDLIGNLKDEFFELHPENIGKVKVDELNNSQRVFKTIFSVHKTLDYAVIPLDPDKVNIDFERATLPLKPEVIKDGQCWYSKYDEGTDFLDNILKPPLEKNKHLEDAHNRKSKSREYAIDIKSSPVPIDDIMKWPPCMRNLCNLPKCGEGQTRALAILASFWGQVGITEGIARGMFDSLAERWKAPKSNIFESYYRKMNTPTCEKLMSDDNRGFPKGTSIKRLGVCKPDARCNSVPSPRYYVDKEANIKRLMSKV